MSERGHTRGQFLGAGAALSSAALASTWRQPALAAAQEADATPLAAADGKVTLGAFGPNFIGEAFNLEIDGASAGFVTDVQGGYPEGELVETGGGGSFKKSISTVKYQDVSFKFAMTQPGSLFDWIKGTLDRSAPRRSGSIKALDADFRVTQEGFFTNAIVTEIGFPAMDGAAKEAAYMSIKFTAETATERSGGTVPSGGVKAGDAGFKFEVGALSSKPPSKIEGITIKQATKESSPGGPKDPVSLDIPNFDVYLDRNSGLSSWIAFYEDFLIGGDHSEADELTGKLTLTNPKGTRTFGSLDFLHMGILSAVPVTEQIGGAAIRRVKAEMYCEDVRFNVGG